MRNITRRILLAASLAVAVHTGARADEPVDSSRLVSIGGSLTEIIYALGEERRLVARDTTSVFPPQALALSDVGYIRALSPEGVLSVKPTAILALEGAGPPEAMAVLKAAGVPLITVPDDYDSDGIVEKIRHVGRALGVVDKAEALASDVAARLARAAQGTAGIAARKRVLFILSMQDGRILAAGADTAADGIIKLAGGKNALAGFTGYKPVSDEAVIAAQPEMVLMMLRSDGHAVGDDALFAHPAIVMTPAARTRSVVRMDGLYMLGFGPRTAAAVHDLAAALYGRAAN